MILLNGIFGPEDTIALAKKENKPLFISIGFSASLWDGILQEKVLKIHLQQIINRYFVPVLVDRHQSRFVDKLYTELNIYQTGRSGWPMIIMATPDGIPLFLTTFLRNDELQVALQRISYDWRKNAASTQKLAENWSEGFSNAQKLSKYKNVTSLNDYFQFF